MTTASHNLLHSLPDSLETETIETILRGQNVRIERILSHGQSSPETGWYDQEENEWVMVLQGRGEIQYENGNSITLGPGDQVNLPAHTKHRVHWTDPDQITVWVAVFYS
ncbi:MAG: cupin domain-containing protein [Puniceicoccales bacterium]